MSTPSALAQLRLRRRPPPRYSNTAERSVAAAALDSPRQRAEALLLVYCTADQARTWREHRYLQVTGSHGGRFCLHVGSWDGVDVYELRSNGQHKVKFCTTIRDNYYHIGCAGLRVEDRMLAVKLHLESNEKKYRLHAHRYRTSPGHELVDPMLGWGG